MKRYKLMFLIIINLLLSFLTVEAQSVKLKGSQEISVYGKGIFNFLTYDLSGNSERNNGHGAGLGMQYSYYLDSKWSVSAGLDFQKYGSGSTLYEFSDFYRTSDPENTEFDFYTSAKTYKENQRINMLNVPLMVKYEVPSPWTNAFIYGAAGVQFGIPLSSKYNASAEDLKTSGYFQQWDAMLLNPGFMGFGDWGTVEGGTQKLDVRNSYALLFEFGFKQQLNENHNLYVGFYTDLGLNQLIKKSNTKTALIEYIPENPEEFRLNPLFYSTSQSQTESYILKPKTRGFGIKLQYAFNLK